MDIPGPSEDVVLQPIDKSEARREENQPHNTLTIKGKQQNQTVSIVPVLDVNTDADGKIENKMIDLNTRPQRTYGQVSNNQVSF